MTRCPDRLILTITAVLFCTVAFGVSVVSSTARAAEVAPQVALPATFTLQASVEIDEPRIMLGRVASCSGTISICDESYGVDLGPVPAPGKTFYLQRQQIEGLLQREWPAAAIRVIGPTTLKVTPVVKEVTTEEIKAAFEQWIADRMGNQEELRVHVKKVQLPRAMMVPPGDHRLTFPKQDSEHPESWHRLDWLMSKILGTQNVEVVRENLKTGTKTRFYATIQSEAEVRVPVTARYVTRGTILRSRHLEMGWQPVKRGSQDFIRERKALYGKILRRSLNIGQGITSSQIEMPRMVSRGERLKMVIEKDGLKVVTDVKALEHGSWGEAIGVTQISTGKRIEAKVLGPGKVTARF